MRLAVRRVSARQRSLVTPFVSGWFWPFADWQPSGTKRRVAAVRREPLRTSDGSWPLFHGIERAFEMRERRRPRRPASPFWRGSFTPRREHEVRRFLSISKKGLTRRAHLRTHGQTAGEVGDLARARLQESRAGVLCRASGRWRSVTDLNAALAIRLAGQAGPGRLLQDSAAGDVRQMSGPRSVGDRSGTEK